MKRMGVALVLSPGIVALSAQSIGRSARQHHRDYVILTHPHDDHYRSWKRQHPRQQCIGSDSHDLRRVLISVRGRRRGQDAAVSARSASAEPYLPKGMIITPACFKPGEFIHTDESPSGRLGSAARTPAQSRGPGGRPVQLQDRDFSRATAAERWLDTSHVTRYNLTVS